MPPVVAAVVAAASAITVTSVVGFVLNTALAIGASYAVGRIFGKKPQSPGDIGVKSQDLRHTFRASAATHKIIYGAARVSGPLYPIGSTGANNQFLHVIVPLAGHELNAINTVLVNGEAASLAKFAGYIRITKHLGAAGQTADTDLVAEITEWTTAHKGQGIAYIYLRLKYNKDLFPSGLQNIQADVEGRKVYDPRTAGTAYSDNWALAIRDYLSSDFGLEMPSLELDDTYFNAAANTSEESVATDTGTQERYTLNGVVDLADNPRDIIQTMLTAGAGTLVPLVEGKARLIPGAYSTPSITLTEADLRGKINFIPHTSRKELFNTVVGRYAGAESGWQVVNFPQVGNATYVTEDNSIVIKRDIDLPYCTDHFRCQRISKILLERVRNGGALVFPAKLTTLQVATMASVKVTISEMGWTDKVFRVTGWRLSEDMGVDLLLNEDAASIYSWSAGDVAAFTPQTTGPSLPVGTVNPTIPGTVHGLELEGLGNSTTFTGKHAKFAWRHTSAFDYQELGSEVFGANSGAFDEWFDGYEISIIDSTGTVIRTERVTDNTYVYSYEKNVEDGGPNRAFTIEVRIKGKQNQLSNPARISVSNPAPALPTNLSMVATFLGIIVKYDAPADLDFAGVRVWKGTSTGFTPDDTNLVYEGPDSELTVGSLASNTTYYLKLAPYDAFGKTGLNESSEFAVTTSQVDTADLVDESVTIQASAYTAAAQEVTDVLTTIQSVAVVSSGEPINIDISMFGAITTSASTNHYDIFVYRDATQVNSFGGQGFPVTQVDFVTPSYTLGTEPFSTSLQDTPGAGSYTYYLKARMATGVVMDAYDAYIHTLEIKK